MKLAIAAALSLSALFATTPERALALILSLAALYGCARLGAKAAAQDGMLVVWQVPLVVAVYLAMEGRRGLVPALLVSSRVVLFSLPTLWLQRVMPAVSLTAALTRVLPSRLAFLLAMTLRFVPLLARDAREIYWLQRLRGARLGPRDLVNPVHWSEACHALAVPLLIRAFHLADEMAVAARQRGVGVRTLRA